MIQSALVAYLKTNFSLTRIYPNMAPLDVALPVLVVDLNSATRARHYATSGAVASGLIDSDFELSLWATHALQCSILAAELITLLENFRGRWPDAALSPTVTHRIADIEIVSESQGFDAATERYDHSVFISIAHD